MKTILIKRQGDNLQWKELASSSTYFNYFPREVRTAADMRKYFADGKYTNAPWQSMRDIDFLFTDINGKHYSHYNVKRGDKYSKITVDLDDTKKMLVPHEELWTEESQLRYLRGTAVSLPKEYDTLQSALKYLATEEPFTLEDHKKEFDKRIKEGVGNYLDKHASASQKYADVLFEE